MKLAIHGATGRMGQLIVRLSADAGGQIVGAIAPGPDAMLNRDVGELAGTTNLGVAISPDVASGLLGADVVIDFSTPDGLAKLLPLVVRAKVGVLSGTTGIGSDCERLLDEAAKTIPVLWSPNTSLGVHVLAKLVTLAARQLGSDFDIEVVETHHRAKVDAPSGTAKRLVEAAEEARHGLQVVPGRDGQVGPRKPSEIGVFAMRGGDIIGDHTVHLMGPGERIEITHRATNRDLFARGALRGARFLVGKKPGRYTMSHVLDWATALS